MKLLLSRGQRQSSGFSLVPLRIGTGAVFKLNAKLEMDDGEKKLLNKYQMARVPLVTSDPMDDLRRGFRPALVLGILAFIVLWVLTSMNFALLCAILVVIVMTIVYMRALREQVMVSDLLAHGRTFWCDSVVTLIEKEDDITRMCQYLRQVIESAKYWDDREAIAIEPLSREDLKQAILRARR